MSLQVFYKIAIAAIGYDDNIVIQNNEMGNIPMWSAIHMKIYGDRIQATIDKKIQIIEF